MQSGPGGHYEVQGGHSQSMSQSKTSYLNANQLLNIYYGPRQPLDIRNSHGVTHFNEI